METAVSPHFCGKSTFLDCFRAAASCGLGLQVPAGKSPGVGAGEGGGGKRGMLGTVVSSRSQQVRLHLNVDGN